MNEFHKNLVGSDIHVIQAFEYPDAATRLAASGFSSSDIGKVARQTDGNSFWVLTSTTPTWVPLTSQALYASGVNVVSTTSTSPVLVPGMTFTPEAGLWSVFYSSIAAHSAAAGAMNFGLYFNGTLIPGTLRALTSFSSLGVTNIAVGGQFTADGNNDVEARFYTSSGTVYSQHRAMIAKRIS